ncbi:sulfite exporter TauE/SafE family protein [Flaviflagellibacter deserti]|uniref:Probable membrane transporter protein n=1 Tax=Flaviflagellibacter deserti TaxID=2267266 RepID=A0ABV9Z241_9HYPH
MADYAFVLVVGLAAGCLSGIVGAGASVLLLPVLVLTFGPQQAVPIMAISALFSNVGKVAAWWREIDWRACLTFALPGIPAAALGARTLLALPPHLVELFLGIFFILMIPARRWLRRRDLKIGLPVLAVIGAIIGFLTGIVMSTGPLNAPAFAAYGLAKGPFISTEAMSSLLVYIAKVTTFRSMGALPDEVIVSGLIVGVTVMAGTFLGKQVVQRMSVEMFQHVLDGMLLISGTSMLWAAAAR